MTISTDRDTAATARARTRRSGAVVVRGERAPRAPRVSVIVHPRGSACLERALASVRAQDYRDFELIVVDDGEPLALPARRDDVVLVRPRLVAAAAGPGAARNHGAAVARGEYLALLDGDDWFCPGKLAAQVRFHDAQPDCVLSCGDVRLWPADPRAPPEVLTRRAHHGCAPGPIPFAALFRENCVPCSTVMVRRDAWLAAGGMPRRYAFGEDYALWLRLALRGTVGYLDRVLCERRAEESGPRAAARLRGEHVALERAVYDDFLAEHPELRAAPFVRAAYARLDAEAGRALLRRGAYREARAALLASLWREPGAGRTWRSLARACLQLGSV